MVKTIVLNEVKSRPDVQAYIQQADKFMGAIGYTEHGFRHADLVAHIAQNILRRLSFPKRQAELAAIAGFLHDIGNVIGRENHGISGALIAKDILQALDVEPEEIAIIMSAIGNHEEDYGWATNEVASALILADKSDVHRTRVRTCDMSSFDIHDRVNYAAERSFLRVGEPAGVIALEIEIDTKISQVMDYFEIFLSRMIMCRRAAEFLDCKFSLLVNDVKLL